MRTLSNLTVACALAAGSLLACGGSNSTGADGAAIPDGGADMTTPPDGMPPPPPLPGNLQVTASGGMLSQEGYDFPSDIPSDLSYVFVDGWQVHLDELLVTFDNVSLAENPDKSIPDQAATDAKVAAATGPWAVDLHKSGSVTARIDPDLQAVAIVTLANQNLNGNQPFDPNKRYAFGFDVVRATAGAKYINLDTQQVSDYELMIRNGWTVLYAGTATFLGGTSCTSTNPAYDFSRLPTEVQFKFGFATPTSYLNCQNPDNEPNDSLGGEIYQRGINIKAGVTTVAEISMHAERAFWQSFAEEMPAHFDQIAARAKPDASGNYSVTIADLAGVDFTAFKDASAVAMPWHSCVTAYVPPNTSPSMGFDPLSIPYNPTANASTALRDYRDYMSYAQSSEVDLNGSGPCFVRRLYPSP